MTVNIQCHRLRCMRQLRGQSLQLCEDLHCCHAAAWPLADASHRASEVRAYNDFIVGCLIYQAGWFGTNTDCYLPLYVPPRITEESQRDLFLVYAVAHD